MRRSVLPLVLLACATGTSAARADVQVVPGPDGRLAVADGGRTILREATRVGYRAEGRWWRATAVVRRGASSVVLRTGDPAGRTVTVRLGRERDGIATIDLAVAPAAGVEAVGAGFAPRDPRERRLGFGSRSDAVDQKGRTVLNRVEEGPYVEGDYAVVSGSVPAWALRRSQNASSFPIPWLLSSSGYGVLVRGDRTTRFRLPARRPWSVEVDGPRAQLAVVGGPRPADALRRMSALVGRQPAAAAPWQWGTWFQTGHQNTEPDELANARTLRAAGVPVSVVETHMRYMPCGADRGQEASERARTRALHDLGLAAITYVREAVCASDDAAFADGVARGAFVRREDGTPYLYDAFVGSGVTALGQIDFTTPAGETFYASQLARPLANGYDGWMEDYGEYVPFDAVGGDGTRGDALHNAYPRLYHAAAHRIARRQDRPIVRFQRSGWTGAAKDAQIVWGGDPTTDWGFDGLRSAVNQALTMGLSGVSTWGSDIGGFFTLTGPKLTPELLQRWIQLGLVSGVMRTKAEGIGQAQDDRPQVWDPAILPVFRRYTRLRTQLLPYVEAADATYRRTGLPMMRHLVLTTGAGDPAARRDDAFGFGDDLLAAPVLAPGARRRTVLLPRGGAWVDVWQAMDDAGRHGALRLADRRAAVLRGGRHVTVAAPLDRLPLFARAGALLPLLDPATDTLASAYDTRSLRSLRETRGVLRVVALPRGTTTARASTDVRLRSVEGPRRWTFTLTAERARTLQLEASLATLRRPFAPRRVTVDGRPARLRHDARSGVVRVDVPRAAREVVLRVTG